MPGASIIVIAIIAQTAAGCYQCYNALEGLEITVPTFIKGLNSGRVKVVLYQALME